MFISVREGGMKTHVKNPQIRQGQFLWKDESGQKKYLQSLKRKISEGFYFSDKVISRVVEELAPVFHDNVEKSYSGSK